MTGQQAKEVAETVINGLTQALENTRTRLAAAEQELAEAKAGWEAADTQISIEAGDVMRLTKERNELLNDMETSACELIVEVQALRRKTEAAEQERDELRAQLENAEEEINMIQKQFRLCVRHGGNAAEPPPAYCPKCLDGVITDHSRESVPCYTCATTRAERDNFKSALKAAQEENERLSNKVHDLQLSLTWASRARDQETVAKRSALECAEQLKSQLTAAQQSAKEQFGAGMERAAEIVESKRINRMADVDSILTVIRKTIKEDRK